MPVDRPHIVLITSDQQRCDTLAAYGGAQGLCPHQHRLTRDGATFDNAHTSAPVCLPARAGLLYGLNVPAHYVLENGFQPLPGLTPFTDHLRRRGYFSAVFGKTHFGPCPESYDLIHGLFGTRETALDDLYRERFGHGPPLRDFPHDYRGEETRDGFIATLACEHVAQHFTGPSPTFTHVSFNTPHGPYHPPTAAWDRVKAMTLPDVPFDPEDFHRLPDHYTTVLRSTHITGHLDQLTSNDPAERETMDRNRRMYYAMAVHLDDQVGRLLDAIEASGAADRTLVIYTSDHGVLLYEHGITDKHFWYDPSWRVPLMIRYPGVVPAGARAGFASLTDVTATVLAAAGCDVPDVQGFDLVGPLATTGDGPRTAVAAALHNTAAVATRRWKLEHYVEENRTRLWDRLNDANELHDLWTSPAHRELGEGLLRALLRWHMATQPWAWLAARAWGAGPIGEAAIDHVRRIRGTDADTRLMAEAEACEAAFTG